MSRSGSSCLYISRYSPSCTVPCTWSRHSSSSVFPPFSRHPNLPESSPDIRCKVPTILSLNPPTTPSFPLPPRHPAFGRNPFSSPLQHYSPPAQRFPPSAPSPSSPHSRLLICSSSRSRPSSPRVFWRIYSPGSSLPAFCNAYIQFFPLSGVFGCINPGSELPLRLQLFSSFVALSNDVLPHRPFNRQPHPTSLSSPFLTRYTLSPVNFPRV